MPPTGLGMALSVDRAAMQATLRSFGVYRDGVLRDLRRGIRHTGGRALTLAQFYVPIDEGFLFRHLRLFIPTQGFGFEVGYVEHEFRAAGLPPYYIFQELGFHHWASGRFIQNPHLRPAFEIVRPEFERDVRAMLVNNLRAASQ